MITTISTEPSLIQKVKQQAQLYGVDPALACAVVEQESDWNTWAMRYESAFYVKYIASQVNLSDTERQARATSWGLFQVMGNTARNRGFTQHFLSSLCDPDFGIAVGVEFLKRCLDLEGGDETNALLRWNGGGNKQYASEVLARKGKYV